MEARNPFSFADRSRSAVQQQTVKGHEFRLEGVELNLREMAFLDFAPAVDTGLGFLSFAAVERAEKFIGVVARGDLAQSGPGQSLDRVAAQKFVPVVIEEIA